MQLPMIGQRLAIELRSADLVAAGLLYAYYPAPNKINTDGAVALTFAQTGEAPPWSEQVWHHEYLVRLMVPARGFKVAEVNALETLVMPIWDHFRPNSLASRLIVTGEAGQVHHCYPVRYAASLEVEYAAITFTTIDITFDIKAHRSPGDA